MPRAQPKEVVFFGFFQNFSFGDDTVLFWGNSSGLKRFAGWLRDPDHASTADLLMSGLPWITSVRNTDVRIEFGSDDTGMKSPEGDHDGPLVWRLSKSLANHFADLVEGVAAARHPCHNYLDSVGHDNLVVIVSHGEYDGLEDWPPEAD